MKDLTKAERRALEAVKRGEVRRTYTGRGNTISSRPKGVGKKTLLSLEARYLIEDDRTRMTGGMMRSTVTMVLTLRGEQALAVAS